MDTILEIINLQKSYTNKKKITNILNNISFHINKGETVSILGEGKSGKSSLLSLIALDTDPNFGEILINGEDITNLPSKERSKAKIDCFGCIFENNMLSENESANNNIMEPLLYIKPKLNKKELSFNVVKVAKKLKIEKIIKKKITELSVSDREKVTIAKAIVNNPNIILVDEPTFSMNKKNHDNMFYHLKNIISETQGLLVFTKDKNLASKCDRSYLLKDGILTEIISDEVSKDKNNSKGLKLL